MVELTNQFAGRPDQTLSHSLAMRIFFSLLISLQDFFPSKLCRVDINFTECICIYMYLVVIAVIVLIWSCKALKCGKLYKIILVQLHVFGMSFFRII